MTLEQINGGVIWVDGEPLTSMPRNGGLVPADPRHLRRMRSKIGMVFQHFNLFPHMTALKNCIEAPCTVLKLSKAEAEARAKDLLEMVGLGDKLNHYPAQLSGGQQQRVAIARALAMRPKVMLFAEVTPPSRLVVVLNVIRRLGPVRPHHADGHPPDGLRQGSPTGYASSTAAICEQGPPDSSEPENERTRQVLRDVLEAT